MVDIKVGMINWDAYLTTNQFFGYWAMNSLANEKWCSRLPYFVKKAGNGWTIHDRTQEDYDRELQYAIYAGIDYFAYCWYTEEEMEPDAPNRTLCEAIRPYLHELNKARHLFEASKLNGRIDYCAIILGIHGYSDADWKKLAIAMTKPYYHKINGCPLVYIFGGYYEDTIENIRAAAKSVGMDAYICFFAQEANLSDYSKADAVSVYADSSSGVHSYEEFADKVLANNEARKAFGIQLIPEFSTGWNPMPRVDKPTPWTKNGYGVKDYVPENDGIGFPNAARKLKAWMEKNQEWVKTGHILSYAWNENEEGGFVIPLQDADGKTNTTKLENYKKAVAILKGQAE